MSSALITMMSDETGFNEDPQISRPFHNGSGSAISKGDLVSIDVSVVTFGLGRSIKTSAATVDDPIAVGIAYEDIPDGEIGQVVIRGVVVGANVATGTAVGAGLQAIASAGRLGAAGGVTEHRLGVCLTLAAANVATVYLY